MSRVAIIGAGSWGTALALALSRRGGHTVAIWSHTRQIADSIRDTHENVKYLPGLQFPDDIHATAEMGEALEGAKFVLLVVPSEHLRKACREMSPFLTHNQTIVNATKGLEDGTCLRMTQVIAEVLAQRELDLPCAVLSGPSFAREVGSGRPTAITVASSQNAVGTHVQQEFAGPALRLYTNEDVVGVEMGGALKNVIAIAAGATYGLGLGNNSVAALITRGIAEMTRLAVACGGRRETLAGLAGLGDLVLTCTGNLSRNRYVGIELGTGRRLKDILAGMDGKVAEGVRTTHATLALARNVGVEMPIAEQVAAILNEKISAKEAMRELMARPGRDE